jgi:hypothetical protein
LLRPVTTALLGAGDPVTVVAGWATPPRKGVTVYLVIVRPPSLGAVQRTVACWFWALAIIAVGEPGTVGGLGVIALEDAEGALVPLPFAACT